MQSLQSWKSEVLQSQSFVSPEIKREHDCNSYNSSLEIQNTLARAEMIQRMGDTMTTQSTVDTSKQRELEKTCMNLQSQVLSHSPYNNFHLIRIFFIIYLN